MNIQWRLAAAIAFAAVGVLPAAAQRTSASSPLEGVWSRVQQIGADQTSFKPQPGLRIFMNGHYSWVSDQGQAPRPPIPDSTGTGAQYRAALANFQAQSGRYEVKGQVLTQHPIVALSSATMKPTNFNTYDWRIVADSLWLTQTGNQNGPQTPATGKYVRVR